VAALSVIQVTHGWLELALERSVTDGQVRSVARRNRLLAALPAEDAEAFLLHLRHPVLPNERVLLAPHQTVEYAYFPIDGVVSLLMVMEDGTPVEVATVGNEGFVSVESILSTDQSPYEVICQTEVEALRADMSDLRAAFRASEPLRDALLRYAAVVFSCTGSSVACKVTHPVDQRLARWLLMTRDRVRADNLPLTQDTLARMLGVHRPTISEAAESLRARGLIAYRLGKIAITDRAGLEAASCEHYVEFRQVFEQLLGPLPGPPAAPGQRRGSRG
jgi:CRP-like cAMP-binding protein